MHSTDLQSMLGRVQSLSSDDEPGLWKMGGLVAAGRMMESDKLFWGLERNKETKAESPKSDEPAGPTRFTIFSLIKIFISRRNIR